MKKEQLIDVLRKHKDSPFRIDRVVRPWEAIQDLQEHNQSAFSAIEREIAQVTTSPDHQSRGVLILGEAGTGKTHLLARLFNKLSHDYHMLFVSAPANPEGITSFTWCEVFESLQQKLPEARLTQGEELLSRAFVNILQWSLNDPTWSGKGTDYWNLQIKRIEQLEPLGDELETVRNRILQAWQKRFPTQATHLRFLTGLFNFIAYRDHNRRTILREWLTNYEIESDDLKSLGLQSWSQISDGTSESDLTSRREAWALKALETISQIATVADRPLILAFDQLEMMNGNLPLTRAWGHAVKQIMDMASNLVVVTCIFPSLWRSWFTQTSEDGLQGLDAAAADRIKGGGEIHLEPISIDLAERIVHKRIKYLSREITDETVSLLFPRSAIEGILESLGSRRSIRTFLKSCHERYNELVFKSGSKESDGADFFTILHSAFREASSKQKLRTDTDDHQIKRIEEIIGKLYSGPNTEIQILAPKKLGKRVLPPSITLKIRTSPEATREVVIGLCNQAGQGLRFRVKNWLELKESLPKADFFLLRSKNAKAPGKASQISKDLKQLEAEGKVNIFNHEQESFVVGLYGLLQAIAEKELEFRGRDLTIDDYRTFFFAKLHEEASERFHVDLSIFPKLSTVDQKQTEKSNLVNSFSSGTLHQSPVRKPSFVAHDLSEDMTTNNLKEQIIDGENRPPGSTKLLASRKIPTPKSQPPKLSVPKNEVEEIFNLLSEFALQKSLPIDLRSFDPEGDAVAAPHLVAMHFRITSSGEFKTICKHELNLALAIKRKVRIYPNINLGKVTFEIERRARQPWSIAQALADMPLPAESDPGVIVPLGMDCEGKIENLNLCDPPHLLVGGAAGQGKSNFLSCIVASILCRYSADHVRIQICDPKKVDFSLFKKLNRQHIEAVHTSDNEIVTALEYEIAEMHARYELLKDNDPNTWSKHRRMGGDGPFRIVLIDEAAQLLHKSPEAATMIEELAQLGRAAGIGLILATQYPTAEILTSSLKVNFNHRVAFKYQSGTQSRVVLDEPGAENLLGKGDCLAKTGANGLRRFITPEFDSEFQKWLKSTVDPIERKAS